MSNQSDFVIENGVLKEYVGQDLTVTVPEGVKIIGKSAFASYRCRNITSVTLPEGITEIGDKAFQQLEKLTCVILPGTLKKIGKSAFSMCKSLTSLQIPESVTQIGSGAFSWCEGLKSVHLPEGLKKVADDLFRHCYQLEEVNIPEGVKEIGMNAFMSCAELTVLGLPAHLDRIGSFAFAGCSGLKQINIPDSCVMETGTFDRCKGLADETGLLIIRNRLYAHYQGDNGTFTVVIPDHVEAIERNAIMGYGVRHLEMNLRCPVWQTEGTAKAYGFAETLFSVSGSTISFRDDSGNIVAKVVLATKEETEPKTNGAILSIRQENHAFDFAGYDAYWAKLGKNPNKIRVALVRLQYPYALTEEMRQVYETFLMKQCLNAGKLLIDEDNGELLKLLSEKQLLSKTALPKLVDYANVQGKSALTAMLLMEQHTAAQEPAPPKTPKPKAKEKPLWKKPKAGTHLIGRYLGDASSVEFPLEFEGIPIEGIANSAGSVPENYQNITSLVIPEGYTVIGNRAFAGCEKLEYIRLPSTLKTVGAGAFADCPSLKEVYWPGGIACGSGVFDGSKIQVAVLQGNGACPFYKCAVENLVIVGGDLKASGYLFCDYYSMDLFPKHIWINGEFDCLEIQERGSLAHAVRPLAEFEESVIEEEAVRAIVTADKLRPAIPGVTDLLAVSQQLDTVDFENSIFVCTGFNDGVSMNVARIIRERGGQVEYTVTAKTRYVVFPDGECAKTPKYKKAVAFREKGKNVAVISLSELKRHMYRHDLAARGEEAAALLQNFIVSVSDGKAVLEHYIGTGTVLEIPEKMGEYPIVKIEDRCFENGMYQTSAAELEKVIIPSGVALSQYSFFGCEPELIRK